MDAFATPTPGAGQAGAITMPAVTINFSTEPASPHKGANTVRVRLTGSDGKPVTGAQVTATFFLPAMPAMGMAAVRSSATLPEKGGVYEGPLQLQTAGTWQVTVNVQRDGKTIASKQLSVSVTGGM
jgi:nitrogen fixation protein FixH